MLESAEKRVLRKVRKGVEQVADKPVLPVSPGPVEG